MKIYLDFKEKKWKLQKSIILLNLNFTMIAGEEQKKIGEKQIYILVLKKKQRNIVKIIKIVNM
jgi:hypothetical protein